MNNMIDAGLMTLELTGTRTGVLDCAENLAVTGFCVFVDIDSATDELTLHVQVSDGSGSASSEYQHEILTTVTGLATKAGITLRSHGVVAGHAERLLADYHISLPLARDGVARQFSEAFDTDLVWDELRLLGEVPESVPGLRTAAGADWINVSQSFSAYLRQAETYYRSAMTVRNSSASLLYYYSLLNLAKAELLTWRPSSVLGQDLGHGVRTSTQSEAMSDWTLGIRNMGAFPLLYEKRLGFRFPSQAPVRFTDLLGRCHEIGSELRTVNAAEGLACPTFFTVVTDTRTSSARLLTYNFEVIERNDPSRAVVYDAFTRIAHPQTRDVRVDFAVSSRVGTAAGTLLESDLRLDVGVGDPSQNRFVSNLELPHLSNYILERLHGVVEWAHEYYDCILTPSLSETHLVPMPTALSRYLCMYVASSLVRYHPSALDSRFNAAQAWLMDAFTRQAGPLALTSACSHIRGEPLAFMPMHRT